MSVSVNELGDALPTDFRRANGSPMVSDPKNPGKNQRYSRPSSYGKPLDDENALVKWKIDTAMLGVASSRALAAKVAAVKDGDKESKATLREEAIQTGKGNEASDEGTALHAMSVRFEDPDDDFTPPEHYLDSLQAYVDLLGELGLVSVKMEFQVVNDHWRCAGTCDRLYETTKPLVTPEGEILPVGTLLAGDLKTGKKLDFSLPGYTVQMALYAQGTFYDVVDNVRLETPDINQRWGVLVHMPASQPGVVEFFWIDLDVGNYGAWLAHEIKQWRNKWKRGEYDAATIRPWHPEVTVEEEFVEILEAIHEAFPDTEEVDRGIADDEWLKMMTPFVQQRINTVRDHADAKKMLLTWWPEGVPTPKKGITTIDEMEKVLNLLDKVEAEHGLSFPPGDPRAVPGVHEGAINTNNRPKEN